MRKGEIHCHCKAYLVHAYFVIRELSLPVDFLYSLYCTIVCHVSGFFDLSLARVEEYYYLYDAKYLIRVSSVSAVTRSASDT